MQKKKWIVRVAAALILELFVFNYKIFLSVGEPVIAGTDKWSVTGMERTSSGSWREIPENYGCFETGIMDIDAVTLHVDLELHPGQEEGSRMSQEERQLEEYACGGVWIELWATDEGHEDEYYLGRKLIAHGVKSSQYMILKLQGKAKRLKFYVTDLPDGAELTVHELDINKRVPLCFSLFRFLLTLFLFAVRDVIKNWIRTGGHPFTDSGKQKLILLSLVMLQILIFLCVGRMNTAMWYSTGESRTQYQNLARSLSKGQTWLEYEPGENLQNMKNPYDRTARDRLMQETGESYRWDHAYYNGKYYVYFGIVPELAFYYPYYILTGRDFQTHTGVMVSGCVFLIGCMMLLRSIVKRWFQGASLELMGLMYVLLVNCCGALGIMARPDFYSLPILLAVTFAVWGLYFWISAEGKDGARQIRLFIGSICIALTAGCRPQIVLCGVTGLFLWGKELWRRQPFCTWLKKACCIFLPFFVVAAGLMYYNTIRFGNPFDFGAVYNLTVTDMTTRGVKAGRIPQAVWMYFLQPAAIGMRFPFIGMVNSETAYLGAFIRDRMFGGILMTVPPIWLSVWMCRKKEWFADSSLYGSMVYCILAALVTAVTDAQMAGIYIRYINDFGWLLLFATWIAILQLERRFDGSQAGKYLKTWVFAGVFVSIVFHFLQVFVSTNIGADNIMDVNPEIFSRAEHLIAFWS